MQVQDLSLANAANADGIVAAYGSKTDPSGGIERWTMQLIKQILFPVLRMGCWLSRGVRFVVSQLTLKIMASALHQGQSTSVIL